MENIAKHCSKDEDKVHELKNLDEKGAFNLFTETVFQRIIDWDKEYTGLTEEAKSILKKCNGFPLAILTVGGVLAKRQKTLVEWRKLNEYIGAEQEEDQTIKLSLPKCFDCLPYDLKSCFLYLSIFPEDHIISWRRLVHRWTAEGYSSNEHGKSAKETAEEYFTELLDRSLILPFVESIGRTKGTDYCKFNDLIHEMSTSKSAERNLVLRLEEGCGMKTKGKIRHLSVISDDNWKGGYREFENTVHPSFIRSLTVFGKWRPFFISEKMRMLRVLDLEGTSDLSDHHLEHIGKLLHLKYLSLRWCRDIFSLPHSLGNLQQLETLDIKYTSIVKLPKAIIRLRKLQYFRAGGDGIFGWSSYQEMVQDMPELMRNRLCMMTLFSALYCVACCAPQIKEQIWEQDADAKKRDLCTAWCCAMFPFVARRLDARGVVVPTGFNKLSALHTLATINIGQGKAVQDLRRLIELRKLGVVGVSRENREEFCLALSALSNLETLSVRSEGEPGLDGCLESDDLLYSPLDKLKSLKLDGNLVKLPGWINRLHHLVKLKLKKTNLSDLKGTVKAIGKLQSLKKLCLLEDSFKGEKLELSFDREAPFTPLVVLQLSFIRGLKSVDFDGDATPNLKLVYFVGYPRAVNDGMMFSGLASLQRLKEFMLDNDDDYKEDFVKHLQSQLTQNSNKPVLRRF